MSTIAQTVETKCSYVSKVLLKVDDVFEENLEEKANNQPG